MRLISFPLVRSLVASFLPLAMLLLIGGQRALDAANAPPTVATAAAATPNPTSTTTTALSVLGADDGGAAALIYTWATTGTPPAAVAFSANGTNAARATTATFTKAGSYAFTCTIRDAGSLTTTSSVTATVTAALTTIAVSPGSATVEAGQGLAFSAIAKDQFATALTTQPTITWTASGGGTISSTGSFTAGASAGGPHTVTASSGGRSGTANVTVASAFNAAPVVATPTATPLPITGTTVTLAVVASDDDGASNLTYSWGSVGTQPGPIASNINGTTAAQTVDITFAAPGTYTMAVVVSDARGAKTVSPAISLVVQDAVATVHLNPTVAVTAANGTRQFSALARNQFGVPLATQPTFTWAVSGGGTISSAGLFTAGSTTGGPYTVTATSGARSVTGSIRIGANAAPTLVTVAACTPSPVVGTSCVLSALGADDLGEPGLTYSWFISSMPSGAVVRATQANGTNAGKSIGALFDRAGAYTFLCRIADGGGLTRDTSVSFTVAQTFALGVSPATAGANPGASGTFAASVRDQFGALKSPQPTFTWAVSGGGTISSAGVFTSGSTPGGPYTVTATGGGLTGTAQIRVNAAPTVARIAAVEANPVTGTTVRASVLGADDFVESQLTYTWDTTGTPPAAVAFSANGSNAARNTTITFAAAGGYTLRCTIADAGGRSVTSSVAVTVGQTLTSVVVTPATASVANSGTRSFAASAQDQFAIALATQPSFTWAIDSGGLGTVSSAGLFTAPATGTGSATVRATTGTRSGTATVTVTAGDTAPTVATAAACSPSPVTGTTATLSVLGADNGGESALIYTWATTGTPPAAVTFSANGTNAAKSTTATFTKAGSYTLQATIRDAGSLTATSSVTVTVNQTLTSIALAPASTRANPTATAQFTATAKDQFATNLATQPGQGTYAWSISGTGNTISTTGLATAGSTTGSATVTATHSGRSGTATLVVNAAPTVATVAACTPSPVTGTTATLSALGADDAGESALTYTWATTGSPPAAVTFSANGTNAAKSTTATFAKAGAYTFQVTIADGGNRTVASSVTVTVNATLTSVALTPATASVANGATQTFAASARDQFGIALTTQPTFTWAIDSGGIGTVSSAGLFTAPATGTGSATVHATTGTRSGTAAVTVAAGNTAPTVATAAACSPSPVTGTTATLSVLGADNGGESALIYTWATTGTPPAAVTFSANGTNGAKSTTATFTKAGSYTLQATIRDAGSLTATSSITVTVNQTLTSIVIAPASTRANPTGTAQFTATARDQFATNLATQPGQGTYAWSISGTGNTISTTGLATAGGTTGSATVTATHSGRSGTATLVVNAAPTVSTAAACTPSPVTGTTATLSALGADDAGESVLTYTWATTGSPPAAVMFSVNGTNAAKSTTATFAKAGSYTFQVTIADGGNRTVTSSVAVTVNATLTSVALTPATASVANGATQTFAASARDQFAIALATQPSFTWAIDSGGLGTVSSAGLFTAPATGTGSATVRATTGTRSGTAAVTVTAGNTAPTVATAAACSPSPVTGTTATLSVLGADNGGESALTYTWATTGTPPAAVMFSANGTNAAKSTTATFTKAGSYTLQATIRDAGSLTATSSVTVTVNQTLTSIVLASASTRANPMASAQFTATARDQFAANLATQPGQGTYAWSISGTGNTISTTGLATAGSTTGSATVTATHSGRSGTATLVVNAAPTVATVAACSPSPVTGTTATLSVLGADDAGESALAYSWSVTTKPTGASNPTFNVNGTNAAKSAVVTFITLGSYTLRATITDGGGRSVTSTVTITVNAPPADDDSDLPPTTPTVSLSISGGLTGDQSGTMVGETGTVYFTKNEQITVAITASTALGIIEEVELTTSLGDRLVRNGGSGNVTLPTTKESRIVLTAIATALNGGQRRTATSAETVLFVDRTMPRLRYLLRPADRKVPDAEEELPVSMELKNIIFLNNEIPIENRQRRLLENRRQFSYTTFGLDAEVDDLTGVSLTKNPEIHARQYSDSDYGRYDTKLRLNFMERNVDNPQRMQIDGFGELKSRM